MLKNESQAIRAEKMDYIILEQEISYSKKVTVWVLGINKTSFYLGWIKYSQDRKGRRGETDYINHRSAWSL